MNRFIFTSLIIAQLLISIHSRLANENAYAYDEISDELFKPIVIEREVMNDDMKKSLGSSLINLADVSPYSLDYYFYGNQLNTFEKKIYVIFAKLCQTPLKNLTTEYFSIAEYKVAKSNLMDSLSKAALALRYDHPEYWWNNGLYEVLYFNKVDYVDRI